MMIEVDVGGGRRFARPLGELVREAVAAPIFRLLVVRLLRGGWGH